MVPRQQRRTLGGWLVIACVSVLAASTAAADEVTLVWDPVIASNIGGYIVDWGLSEGSYTWSLDVANNSEVTLTGLTKGTKYYFAVRTYDDTGLQSGYSNEVGLVVGFTETTTTQNTYRSGELLSVGNLGDNPGVPTTADFYFCLTIPGGDDAVCITDFQTMSYIYAKMSDLTTLRPCWTGSNLAFPYTWSQDLFAYRFRGGETPGEYTAFMMVVTSGALSDGVVTSTESIGYGAKAFNFTP